MDGREKEVVVGTRGSISRILSSRSSISSSNVVLVVVMLIVGVVWMAEKKWKTCVSAPSAWLRVSIHLLCVLGLGLSYYLC